MKISINHELRQVCVALMGYYVLMSFAQTLFFETAGKGRVRESNRIPQDVKDELLKWATLAHNKFESSRFLARESCL